MTPFGHVTTRGRIRGRRVLSRRWRGGIDRNAIKSRRSSACDGWKIATTAGQTSSTRSEVYGQEASTER